MFLYCRKNPSNLLVPQKLRHFRFTLRNISSDKTNGELIDPNCDAANPKLLTFSQISSAAFNIRDGIVHTDCRRSYNLSSLLGMDIFLKLELNQVTGNFKERGARWALLRLKEEDRKRGVWAASAGNHALSLSYHGKQLGVPVNVVMPEVAPLMKIDFCSRLGASVIIMGKDMAETRKIALQKCIEADALYINVYDYIDCCAGAGTVGLEILQQMSTQETALLTDHNGRPMSSTDSASSPTPGVTASNKLTATVKSSDGKFHKVVLDPTARILEFTVLKSDSRPTNSVLLLTLNEILAVRGSKIKLANGIPKGTRNDWGDEENKATPNVLYIYYAFRRNIYLWRVREAMLIFTTTAEKKQWLTAFNTTLKSFENRPKSLRIFVNPFGGKGKARSIYHKFVEPFLDLVGVERQVIETERANHAYDIIKGMDAAEWNAVDGVVCVGGDGLFNEVLSSTIIRTQEENGKDIEDLNVNALVTPRVRFGIIGAGSANSIVSSVHGVDDWATAAIHIAIGSKCAVDVCTVHEDSRLLRISANAISYGWLGDVLHDSEYYRCMGPIRYQWSALRTSIRHPTYYGRVSFALSNLNDDATAASIKFPKCTTPCRVCDGTESEENYPFHWQTDFTHVICCVIPCVSPFTPYGLAPYAGVGDGSMDLALVPKVSRCENLQIMRKVSMYGGKGLIRLTQSNLYVFRVKRWKFTPSTLITDPVSEIATTTPATKSGTTSGVSNGAEAETESTTVNEEILSPNAEDLSPSNVVTVESERAEAEEAELAGAWNLDGEILPQPARKSLHFRLHERLINYFGRELDLDDPRYQRCLCCSHKPKRHSKIVVIG